jgi:hypothetical protein
MSYDVATRVLLVLAAYLVVGSIVAVPFLIFGIGSIDAAAKKTPWTFRVLVLPGTVALWPFLLKRWLAARRAQ